MSVIPVIVAKKKAEEIKAKFIKKGAVSPDTALTLEELELSKKPLFEIMILKKHIVENENKYYFDVEKFNDRTVKKLQNFIAELFEDTKE